MKFKIVAVIASAIALTACLLGASGCSGNADAKALQGVWQVEDSNPTVTVVFTESEWKLATGITYTYSVDSKNHTVTYKEGEMEGSATYELSADKKKLTWVEDAGDGETKTTVFDKVSDDTSAEPSVGEASK